MKIIGVRVQGVTAQYDVTVTPDGSVHCTCPAFRFGSGKHCKHLDFVRHQIRAVVNA